MVEAEKPLPQAHATVSARPKNATGTAEVLTEEAITLTEAAAGSASAGPQ